MQQQKSDEQVPNNDHRKQGNKFKKALEIIQLNNTRRSSLRSEILKRFITE